MLREMFALLAGSIPVYAYLNPAGFCAACIGGVLLAVGLWWVCGIYARLWNTAFHLSLSHNLLCGIAALLTTVLFVSFASVSQVGQKVDQEISEWKGQMHQAFDVASDTSESSATTSGTAVPTNTPITSADLLANFEASHPFLHKVLQSAQVEPPEQNPDETFSPTKSIDDVASTVGTAVQIHLGTILLRLRITLVFCLLLVQAIPFGLTGYLAHRDIRPSY
jgi:hypothetical protein